MRHPHVAAHEARGIMWIPPKSDVTRSHPMQICVCRLTINYLNIVHINSSGERNDVNPTNTRTHRRKLPYFRHQHYENTANFVQHNTGLFGRFYHCHIRTLQSELRLSLPPQKQQFGILILMKNRVSSIKLKHVWYNKPDEMEHTKNAQLILVSLLKKKSLVSTASFLSYLCFDV